MPAAVVLAGGGPEPRLAPDLPNKAFMEMEGRPLLTRVLDALRGCAAIDRIIVVGPTPALASLVGPAIDVVPEQGSLMANVEVAVQRLPPGGQVVTVASDLPLLSSDVVTRFLDRCSPGADFYYPIVPQAVIDARYPGVRKTYVKVADGVFCGGSVLLFSSELLDRVRPFVEQVIAARKKPWLLAQLFGWATVMKFASGRLSISEMEARAHEVTGIRGRAVIIESPELALDVDADRPENLAVLRSVLAGAKS